MRRLFHLLAAMLALCSLFLAAHPAHVPAAEPRIAAMFTAAGFALTGNRQTSLGREFIFSRSDCPVETRAVLTETIHRDVGQALVDITGSQEELITVYDGVRVPSLGFRDVSWLWLKRKVAIMLGLSGPTAWDSVGLAVLAPRHCPAPGLDWSILVSDR